MAHLLDSNKIIETTLLLYKRITERFPQSELTQVSLELHHIAKQSETRCRWIRKPQFILRLAISIIMILIFFILFIGLVSFLHFILTQEVKFSDFLQALEAGINTVIIIGLLLVFLVTFETRRKRKRAMISLHALRVLAHIIDMHQLTKDPERLLSRGQWTTSSPEETMTAFELTRYLNYCTEMLSLVGKIAALYAQDFEDQVVLTAVNEIENLTTGLSSKIWYKINILQKFKGP